MPHDVATHWNSTYEMLKFTIKYVKALDMLTSEHKLGLHDYELDQMEACSATLPSTQGDLHSIVACQQVSTDRSA